MGLAESAALAVGLALGDGSDLQDLPCERLQRKLVEAGQMT